MANNKLRRFGEWLEYRREELGMSQDELANKMGDISSFVMELELADEVNLSTHQAEELVLALDLPAHKLLEAPGLHVVNTPPIPPLHQ